jgi:hypothetical protein
MDKVHSHKRKAIRSHYKQHRTIGSSGSTHAATGAGDTEPTLSFTVSRPPAIKSVGDSVITKDEVEEALVDKLDVVMPVVKEDVHETNVTYKIESIVNTDPALLKSVPIDSNIHVCMYTINTTTDVPFLMFHLAKTRSEKLILPYYQVKKTYTAQQIIGKSSNLVKSATKHDGTFIGTIKDGNNFYLFFDLGENVGNTLEYILPRKTTGWYATVHEIVNTCKVLNFPVHPSASSLFINHPDLCFLYNEHEVAYDTPSVGYHGTYYKTAPLISTLGLKQSTIYAMMGPYYYFGGFRKAVRYAGWTSTYSSRTDAKGKIIADDDGSYVKGSIIRFIVFEGKQNVLLNNPNDYYDISTLVEERLDNPKEAKYERLVNKLHDHNGNWAKSFDSIYVGRARLENGGLFMKNYEYIVSQDNQHKPLTQHILDKNTLFKDKKTGKIKWNGLYEHYNIE